MKRRGLWGLIEGANGWRGPVAFGKE